MKSTTVVALGIVVTVLVVLVTGCPRYTETKPEVLTVSPAAPGAQPTPAPSPAAAVLTVTSAAFQAGGTMPKKYTGDGENVAPPLMWASAPAGVKEFALICDDPDAPSGTFTHWVIWGLPATTTKLPENVAKTETVPALGDAKQGKNDADKIGYFGPAPPPGKPHHYDFTVYALDTVLDLKPGATKPDLLKAMAGHIVAKGSLTGMYGR